jgi:hypothetical protein
MHHDVLLEPTGSLVNQSRKVCAHCAVTLEMPREGMMACKTANTQDAKHTYTPTSLGATQGYLRTPDTKNRRTV